MTDTWKIETLKARLLEIHPTFLDVYLPEEDDLEMHFSDGDYMQACEFTYGSETRDILEELADLLGEEYDD